MEVEEKGGRDSRVKGFPPSWKVGARLQEPGWESQEQDPREDRSLVL